MHETSAEAAPQTEGSFTSETFTNSQGLLDALKKHLTEHSAKYEGGKITIVLYVNGYSTEIDEFLSPIRNSIVFGKDVNDILSDVQDIVNKLSQISGGTDGDQGRQSYKFAIESY